MTLPTDLHLEPYDVRTAPDAIIEALTAFSNAMLHERQPDDPPLLASQLATHLRHLPDFVDVRAWMVRGGTRIVAEANVALVRLDQNQHLAQVQLRVLAPYRCQGLGRALLQRVTSAAHADGRTLLMFDTNSRVPAGEAALNRVGAQPGLATHTHQLDLRSLDPQLLSRWTAQGQERAAGYRLEIWEGKVPEADFTAFLQLNQVMNEQPHGELQIEDQQLTAEQLQAAETHVQASGQTRVLAVARRVSDGRLLGFTELSWHPERPSILSQGGTGVLPEARGLGLGRWLKALALQRALSLNAEACVVRTGNADVNAAMRRINEDLGFRPYSAVTIWQLEVSQAQAYLQQTSLSDASVER